MAVFIRDVRTERYYLGFNQWTPEPEQAYDFKEVQRAMKWIHAVKLCNVEVVRDLKHSPARARLRC